MHGCPTPARQYVHGTRLGSCGLCAGRRYFESSSRMLVASLSASTCSTTRLSIAACRCFTFSVRFAFEPIAQHRANTLIHVAWFEPHAGTFAAMLDDSADREISWAFADDGAPQIDVGRAGRAVVACGDCAEYVDDVVARHGSNSRGGSFLSAWACA